MTAANSKKRFSGELRILADDEHLALLDELARETQTTRADQVRQALADHLRGHGMLPESRLSGSDRLALEYLADIRARLVGSEVAA